MSEIRKAHKSDIQRCAEIMAVTPIWEKYERTMDDALTFIKNELNAGNFIWVYEEENTVKGFIGCVEHGMMGEFPYVRMVMVDGSHQGKGIGTKLLNYLEDLMFRNKHLIFMMVTDFNTDALRLYRRLGYEKVGEIPDYKKEGVNEYLLMKRKK
ncbi:MAG: GNAT family N-acetyltransferase [Candidatus Latescibacteria bacterium]|nr:GNAT family N-acetyltransferase [Candidatus Latescibacterota bacterium]